MRSIMVVAGEASSDEHAARVVRELKATNPELEAFGMGGSALRAAGMELVVDIEHSAAVMGLTEVLGSLGKLYAAYRALRREAARRKPALVILVDFPDFNFLLARALKRQGCQILYFISPQLWAWRRGRVRTLKRFVKKVAVIFPFEENFYHRYGIDAEYVGHPFLDREKLNISRDAFLRERGIDPARPVVALLPGSRRSEVERLLPRMVQSIQQVRRGRPGVQVIIPVAHTLSENYIAEHLGELSDVQLLPGEAREALAVADAAVVASGTATIEAALAQVPFVVVYVLAPTTYRVGRFLVRGVKHFAMANLIAGERVVEELLQDEVTPERIALEVERYLGSAAAREKVASDLAIVERRLRYRHGAPGDTMATRVAKIVLELIAGGSQLSSSSSIFSEEKAERRVSGA